MSRKGQSVLGTWIDPPFWDAAGHGMDAARESRYICICNAHSVLIAAHDPEFEKAVNDVDMATSDGASIENTE
jgi:N-acetylglucosaminyldiphosphoundecaprenol N-acetyl-beta-D-mannosaminyltransferase